MKRPRPFLFDTLASIILAVPSSYMATSLMFHRSNSWGIPAVWIGQALVIQLAVSTYHSRLIRPSWWLYRFIPDLFTYRRYKRGLKEEISRLRLERLVATAPQGPTKCTSCTDEIVRDQCRSCDNDTECQEHHNPPRPQYSVHVVWHNDPSRKHLWKAAKRLEEDIFWRQDRDTPGALRRRLKRGEPRTAFVVMVDERYSRNNPPRDAVMAMVRLTWGSLREPTITLKSLQKKPWNVRDLSLLLRAGNVPADLGKTRHTMDFTMLGIHKDWQLGGKYYDDKVKVFNALLAQCGQLAIDTDTRYWTAVMHAGSKALVTRATGAKWRTLPGLEAFVAYAGGNYQPSWIKVTEWHDWLAAADPEKYQQVFGDAYAADFSFELRKNSPRDFLALL
jgi:hypothetical protein